MEEARSVNSSQKRAALKELQQNKKNDMRNYIVPSPQTPSFQSLSTPPLPAKRRRLTHKKLIGFGFVSSTGIDDKVDDQSLFTPADTSINPSEAADVAEETDEDSILAILNRDEVAFRGTIRDDWGEDFIPSPDDEDTGDDNDREADADLLLLDNKIATSGSSAEIAKGDMNPKVASHTAPALQMLDNICMEKFERRLRILIEGVKEFAKGVKYDTTQQGVRPTYPISYSFWFLLCRVSTDELIEVYLAAIPRKVQVLLGRDYFIPESILALDSDWKHYHLSKGVYVNLPFDKLANVYECYIGSTCRTLCRRISEHMRIAQSNELSDDNAKSLHYSYICKSNVAKNFRVIAAFQSRDIPNGHIYLLEAIMMILFQSCRRPQQSSRFMNAECYEIIQTLCINTDIPKVQWTGLNAAWPVVQGFRLDRVPCTNKVCFGKAPQGAGFTLCYICTTFKTAKGRLPTNLEISQLMSEGQKLEEARVKAGPNAPCGDCGRKEYFFSVRHLMHHLAPGVLLCGACVMQLKTYGVMHTTEERAKLVGVSNLVAMRKTEDVLCNNCAVSERSQFTRQHIYNAEVGKVLCSACDSYRRMFGRDRDLSFETKRQASQGTKKLREDGIPVNCQQCNAAETPETCHHYNAITGKVLCKACDLYHRKHGKDRDVSKEIRRQAMLEVKRKRKDGIPLHCDECHKTETTAEIEKKHFSYVANVDRFLCITCKNRLYRAASKAKKAAKDGVGSGT